MKAEVKAKWLDALRSGEYVQGEEWLNREGQLCCLGVLCEVAVKEGVIPAPVDRNAQNDTDVRVFEYGNPDLDYGPPAAEAEPVSDTALPVKVMEWAGLDSPDPRITMGPSRVEGVDLHPPLSNVNDDDHAPFDIIANLIEMFL